MNELANRLFKIWVYTVSHSFLILRSPLKFPDQDGYNESSNYTIDIEFSAVAYIDIPCIINGIEIKELIDDVPEKFLHLKTNLGFKIFQIISQGNFFHIVAGNYQIGKNKWTIEDRIFNPELDHDHDEIIATSFTG